MRRRLVRRTVPVVASAVLIMSTALAGTGAAADASPPAPVTNTGISNAVTCTGTAITPDRFPTVKATASDADSPMLTLTFEVWTADHGTRVAVSPGVQIFTGSIGGWAVSPGLDNGDYAYRTEVANSAGIPSDSWSTWTPFTTRSTPPPSAPEVSSTDFPPGPTGTFTVHSGDPNIVGFTYSFVGSGTEIMPDSESCDYNLSHPNGGWVPADADGSGTITITTPQSWGPHTLHVRSFDDAHNTSVQEASYSYFVR